MMSGLNLPSKITALLILGLIHLQFLSAQPKTMVFQKLDQTVGLPHTFSVHFNVDKDGFFWVGGRAGLNRYDGKKIKNFQPRLNGQNLDANITSNVFQDKKNNRWFTSNTALHCIIADTDSIKTWQLSPGGNSYHYAFHLERDSFLWLTANQQLYSINVYTSLDSIAPLYAYNSFLTYVLEDDKGDVKQLIKPMPWQNSIQRIRYQSDRTFEIDTIILNIPALDWGPFMYIEDASSYWIPSSAGLIQLNPDSLEITPKPFKHSSFSPSDRYEDVVGWQDHYLWIASRDAGLILFDKNTSQFIRQDSLFYTGNQIEVLNEIDKILIDQHENLWLAIFNRGFLHLNLKHQKFDHLYPLELLSSIEKIQAQSIAETADGSILCVISNQQLLIFNPNKQAVRSISLQLDTLNKTELLLRRLFTDQDGDTWILTDQGILLLKNSSGTSELELINLRGAYDIVEISRNEFLLHDDQHIFSLNKSTISDKVDSNSIYFSDVYLPNQFFHEKKSNLVFLSQDDNILRIFHADRNLRELDTLDYIGIVNGFYPSLKSDSIWLATSKGLYKFDPISLNAVPAINHKELENKQFTDVVEDSTGQVWLSSYSGIYKYNPKQETLRHFTENDGLISMQYIENSSLYARNGNIYFGGNKGVTIINPHEIKIDTTTPSLQLIEFKVNKEIVNKQLVAEGKTVWLDHHQNSIFLEFAILDFNDPKNNTLEYLLIRNDTDTILTGISNPIQLPLLGSGKYKLELNTKNSNGIRSTLSSSYFFNIKLPWYYQWWAVLFYIFSFLLITYLFYQFQLNRRLALEERNRLLELDQFKNKLYANITHEFRTPLAVIKGVGEKITQESYFNTTLGKDLSIILRNTTHLQQLVDQMLDLSKIDAGVMRLDLIQSDIISFLRPQLEMFHTLALSKNIQLHFLSNIEEMVMDFDEEKIRQILSNLLANAIKFTAESGHIYLQYLLHTKSRQDFFRIQVKDTGIGIDEENLDKVFDRYYQVDDALNRAYEGTGIGLSLVKELVHLKGGDISVKSKKGIGTEFTIDLPINNNAPLVSRSSKSPIKSGATNTGEHSEQSNFTTTKEGVPLMLIIEDNKDYRNLLCSYFQDRYQIIEAKDGAVGKEKAFQLLPDIILTDIMMPKVDGFELCSILKKEPKTSHIPIIMLTAKGDIDSKLFGLRRGADDYLPKPVNKEELLARADNLLKIRRILQSKTSIIKILKDFNRHQSYSEEAFIQSFIDLVIKYIDEPELKIPFILQKLKCSKSMLNKKVKRACGTTPAKFIRTIRLTKAKEIIQQSEQQIPLKQVAFSVGFLDYPHFSASFKEEFGYNPAETPKHL